MSEQPKQSVDFPAILASSVHDIKNSLATVRELIANLAAKQQSSKSHDFLQLEFEANRMNNSLVQLLELYKIQADKFSLIIDQESVLEILQEVQIQQDPLLRLNKINMTLECPSDLFCFCDYNQISNALSSILNNAQRYSHEQIRLSAYEENDYIVFCLEDDGDGYPPHLLTTDFNAPKVIINQVSGSTGLGLQFVSTIAALHNTQDRQGYIKIDNDSTLGGARFRLFLP